MDILDIAKTVGLGVFKSVVPQGGLILDSINAILPVDYKFLDSDTGSDIARKLQAMPPELQQQIMIKEFDVRIEQIKQEHDTARTMLIQDALNPHSTRPRIAWWSFMLVATVSLMVVSGWLYAVLMRDEKLVTEIVGGWGFISVIIFPFIIWLNRYFGVLRQEMADKLNSANGMVAGLSKGLFDKFNERIR